MGAANDSGEQLVSEVLDDPSVTQQDLAELNELWDSVCQQSVSKQERLDQAMVVSMTAVTLLEYCKSCIYNLTMPY